MFTLWRKIELAESVYFRPLAGFSSSSLTNYSQIDVVKTDSVATTREPEALEIVLKSATHPIQILSSLPSNPTEFRQMPGETVINTLQTISTLQRANKDTIKTDFITSHPNFELLCRRLKRCSTIFTPDELVKSFRFLCSLGVPTNSEISLILLNLIKHEINNLSVNKIIYLDYVLSQAECCSELQNSIQSALPIVFELQISQQIDKDNSVSELVSILNYFASHKGLDINNENLKRICKILCDKNDEITLPDGVNIIHHLCAIDRFHLSNTIKLIATCIRRLMDQITDIDITELQKVINRLISTTVNQFSPFQFHLHGLLKKCAERISQEDLGLKTALPLQSTLKNIVSTILLSELLGMSFQSPALLKYIGDKLISDADVCKTMSSFEVFTIIQAFANNTFIPESADSNENIWSEQILPAILENKNIAQIQPSNHVWLPFTLQLAILGHFDQALITRVLSPSYLKSFMDRKGKSLDLHKVLILYQTASMQRNIDLSCVKPDIITSICKKFHDQMPSCDIQLDLIDHIGSSCVMTNVRTKHMHLIPTLVKMNKQTGHLERFSDDITRDEDGFISLDAVPCRENEVMICVDSVVRCHLFSNVTSRRNMAGIQEITDDMKIGAYRLRRKQLESLGLSVCEINYRRYKNIRMGNKYSYLQESITQCGQKEC